MPSQPHLTPPPRAGVRWFEVDRADVLAAKRDFLARCGAQLSREAPHHSTSSSASGGNRSGGGRAAAAAQSHAHPLRAASWCGVPCDLCAAGWVRDLEAAGFDRTQPTLWVAEGLLMYLTEPEVEVLLQEMAGGLSRLGRRGGFVLLGVRGGRLAGR